MTFPAACLTGDALAQSVLPQARGEHSPGRGMLIWVYAGQEHGTCKAHTLMIAPCYTPLCSLFLMSPRYDPFQPSRQKFSHPHCTGIWQFYGIADHCTVSAVGEILKLRLQQQAATRLNMVAHNAVALLHEEISQQSHRTQVLARAKELWESGLDADSVRTMLDRVQHINPHNVWIGVADTQGTVRNATQGMLQGANVAARPWFQEGMSTPLSAKCTPPSCWQICCHAA